MNTKETAATTFSKCLICQTKISTHPISFNSKFEKWYENKKRFNKYCDICVKEFRKKKIDFTCEYCNKVISICPYYAKNKRFCSQRCAGLQNQTCKKVKSWEKITEEGKRRGVEKRIKTRLETKRRILNSHKIKIQHPKKPTKIKKIRKLPYCLDCNIELKNINAKRCFKCQYIHHNKRRRERGVVNKLKLMNILGGSCQKCGYQKCLRALHFHHINPKTKSFTLDSRHLEMKKWPELEDESKKCDLLCANCHAIHHEIERNYKITDKYQYNLGITRKKELINLKGGCCEQCKVGFDYTQVYTFHHIGNKLFPLDIVQLSKRDINLIMLEFDKCQLLCFNCHMEVHHKIETPLLTK